MSVPDVLLNLSGQRFSVTYRLVGDEAEARAKAEHICVEETVEFPQDLLPAGTIRDCLLGRIESFRALHAGRFEATISYALELATPELGQLLNVVFGNISMRPGIRVERLDLPAELLHCWRGPRFGRQGLRALLGVPARPLLSTALKPLGLSAAQLAAQAYQFALGGMDVIKDDHSLMNQPFAPFEERVQRCSEAVRRANEETGYRCIYAPSVVAPADRVIERALFARSNGAGALLVAPGLVGFDLVRQLADDSRLSLPILYHPTFVGSFFSDPDIGISPYVLFGQIARLTGADAAIFPQHGGRFSISLEDCRSVADGTSAPMAHLKAVFPMPGGGMHLEQIPELIELYGREVVFLIGGNLHRLGPDLARTSARFRSLVESL